MLTILLRTLLLVSSVSVASATRDLLVSTSGPAVVDGVQNLMVETTVTNSGDETLKAIEDDILNDVRGSLSSWETDAFDIISTSGTRPTFVGIQAKYVPERVISDNRESSFTILAPGESVEVEHDLSKAYNFTSSSFGEYTISARPIFTIVDEFGHPLELKAKTEAHVAKISGALAIARPAKRNPTLSKRISYNGCSSTQQSQLVSAAAAAQTYANEALTYLKAHPSSTTRYTTWFGTYTSSRHSTVQSHFQAIADSNFSTYTFDCVCTDEDTYAYVDPNNYGYIYLCAYFWKVGTTGTDSQGGTLIHESSHFTDNGATDDRAYGQDAAKALAISNPDYAVDNADSHEYFAENNPSQS